MAVNKKKLKKNKYIHFEFTENGCQLSQDCTILEVAVAVALLQELLSEKLRESQLYTIQSEKERSD